MKKLLIVLIPLFLAYFIYNIITNLEIFKDLSPINDKNCKVVRGAVGIEDIVKYKKYLIGGSNDNGKLWEIPEYGNKNTPDGKMVIIDTSVKHEDIKIEDIRINNFPSDVAFHPHGIYLYNNKFIYVINHAYHKGGERVEIFKIVDENEKIQLDYIKSLQFPAEFTGIFNDLVVITDEEILITTYLPFADSLQTGRSTSLISKIKNFFVLGMSLPLTHIYHCKGNDCVKVKGTSSIMNNGITLDTKNKKVYASNLVNKSARVFNLNRDSKRENILTFDKEILLGFAVDNLEYDKETGLITCGVLGTAFSHIEVAENLKKFKTLKGVENKVWYGSLQIDTNNNDKVDITVMENNMFYGISSAIKFNDLIFHTSWVDDGTLICKI